MELTLTTWEATSEGGKRKEGLLHEIKNIVTCLDTTTTKANDVPPCTLTPWEYQGCSSLQKAAVVVT